MSVQVALEIEQVSLEHAVRSVADGRPVSDVDDRFVLRAVDPDPGGIDSVAYRIVLFQRNVGRREAERPSEPVASRDFAFDERIHRFSDSCRALELLPGRVLDRPGASGGACAFLLGNIFYFCSAKVGRIIRIPNIPSASSPVQGGPRQRDGWDSGLFFVPCR